MTTTKGTPLRVGAYYLPRGGKDTIGQITRGGQAIGPLEAKSFSFPYEFQAHGISWCAGGRYLAIETGPSDLLLECTSDGVPLIGTETPAAFEGECPWLKTVAKPKPAPFAFAAGQCYRLANGGVTGPMMRSADDTYWCDPEHKNAHGAPWEYRDDGTTEPSEFNVVGLVDADEKSVKSDPKHETVLEIRGAWIPKGGALSVASVTESFASMLRRRQSLQDAGRLACADAGPSVAVADPVVENPPSHPLTLCRD